MITTCNELKDTLLCLRAPESSKLLGLDEEEDLRGIFSEGVLFSLNQ